MLYRTVFHEQVKHILALETVSLKRLKHNIDLKFKTQNAKYPRGRIHCVIILIWPDLGTINDTLSNLWVPLFVLGCDGGLQDNVVKEGVYIPNRSL